MFRSCKEQDVEDNREAIEDLMRRYGFEEAEARAYYHLNHAEQAFEEMETDDEPGRKAASRIAHLALVRPHFFSLRNQVTRRVWLRDYPDEETE
jgi:hypothetical protein